MTINIWLAEASNRNRIYPVAILFLSFFWVFFLSSIISLHWFNIGLDNFWFDADVPRYICQSVDRLANDHWRNKVHPLFSLLSFPLPNALALFGIDIVLAIRLQFSLVVGVGSMFLYATLQRLTGSNIISFLLIAIALSGSSALVWFTVPESYAFSFSAFSIILFLSSSPKSNSINKLQWLSAICLAFSITVTNVVVAAWAALYSCGIRRAVAYTLGAIAVVGVLAVIQRLIFPSSGVFFLPTVIQGESSFLVGFSLERLRQVLSLFFVGSLVFPDVQLIDETGKDAFLTIQQATWSHHSLIPTVAIVLVSVFTIMGTVMICRTVFRTININRADIFLGVGQSALEKTSITVLGSIFFLILLHLFYGTETFVYSGSFLPFLILLLGIGATRLAAYNKGFTLILLALLLSANLVHGLHEWRTAVDAVHHRAEVAPDEKAMGRNTCSFVKRKYL